MHQIKTFFSLKLNEETLMKSKAHALDEKKFLVTLALFSLTQCLGRHLFTVNKSGIRHKSTAMYAF